MKLLDSLILTGTCALGAGVGALVAVVGWGLWTGQETPPWGLGGGCAGVGAIIAAYFTTKRL